MILVVGNIQYEEQGFIKRVSWEKLFHMCNFLSLTCSLNKRQTICTMAREVLMSHMAHVGLPQAQFAQKYF